MGSIQHHAIIVTGSEKVKKIRAAAKEIFGHVSEVVESHCNDYYSFMVAPDGSKEGWRESNEGDEKRANFTKSLKELGINYIEVTYGELGVKVIQ